MKNVKAIITDIEGTTSSLSFVKDVLFPYASKHLESFIEKNQNNAEVIKILYEVLDTKAIEHSALSVQPSPLSVQPSPLSVQQKQEAINILQNWIKLDLKIKPLKDLQGLIWEQGYKDRDFYGHIYDDAYEKLKEWHEQGIKIYVYSSGSVYAQQLLFGHTKFGDLNYLFSGNFDTSVGHKRDPGSYVNIIEAISKQSSGITLNLDNILFLSDIEEELRAAADTGIRVIKINREEKIINANSPNSLQELDSFTLVELN